METYETLREEFDRKVEALRERCTHPKVSGWMVEWWAPAHSTGHEVKACEICGMVVNRRANCSKCGRLLEEKEFVYGKGDTRPTSEVFCQACEDKWREFTKGHPYVPRVIEVTVHATDGSIYTEKRTLDEGMHYMEVYEEFMKERGK